MYQTLEIVHDKLRELKEQLSIAKSKEEELVDKLCSQRTETKYLEYNIQKIESELKALSELQRNTQGQDNGCSVSSGLQNRVNTLPDGLQGLRDYTDGLKKNS